MHVQCPLIFFSCNCRDDMSFVHKKCHPIVHPRTGETGESYLEGHPIVVRNPLVSLLTRPGKRLHNYGKIHHFLAG